MYDYVKQIEHDARVPVLYFRGLDCSGESGLFPILNPSQFDFNGRVRVVNQLFENM